MTKITTLASIGLGVGLAIAGCHRQGPQARHEGDGDLDRDHDRRDHDHDGDHDDVEGESPDLGSGLSTRSAVRSIAHARCEREQRCGNIGADETYASEAACEEKVRSDWAGDLNKYECPHGVVDAELNECLADIRDEDCGNPFDTLSRVVSCASADICDD